MKKAEVVSEKHRKVLSDLVETLNRNGILFQATSGLAANAYGSTRPLYDIDIDVYAKDIPRVVELFKGDIIEPFHHEVNEHFDLYELMLDIDGVIVDISQAEDSFVIGKDGRKFPVKNDIEHARIRTVEGISFRTLDKDELITYKNLVGRDTDISDVVEITRSSI